MSKSSLPSHSVDVLIVAAGRGERMRPLSYICAKPAMPVLGEPLVWHTVNRLEALGFGSAHMTLFHHTGSVLNLRLETRFEKLELDYIIEPELLGTGGGLRNAVAHIDAARIAAESTRAATDDGGVKGAREAAASIGDDLLVCPSDTLWDFDVRPAIAEHMNSGRAITFILVERPDWQDYSAIRLDESNRIVQIGPLAEAPDRPEAASSPYTFTGMAIYSRTALDVLPRDDAFDIMTDFIGPALRDGMDIGGYVVDGFWADVGEPRKYIEGVLDFAGHPAGMPPENIIGDECTISEDAKLSGCVLWDQVHVHGAAVLENCILASGVEIESGAHISDAMVIPAGVQLPDEAAPPASRIGEALIFPF